MSTQEAKLAPPSEETRVISLIVNGRSYQLPVEPRKTLLDFVREDVGMTGVRMGCEHGVCGACTILVDGRAVRSCLMFAVQAAGRELLTVEGLAKGDQLHPIQQAFWEEHGLQCGYCTAGFMMSIYELLNTNSDPSEAEIYETLGGNICRCTGYQNILRSVYRAVELIKEGL